MGLKQVSILLCEAIQQPLPTGIRIVRQEFDTVDTGHCQYGIFLVLQLCVFSGFDAGLADSEFAAENLNEEVAVSACGFQETGIEPLRFRFDKVQHGIHLTGIGKYLPVCGHPVLGLDLGVHSALSLRTGNLLEAVFSETQKA